MKSASSLPLTEALLSIASVSDPLVSKMMLQVVYKANEPAPRKADDPRNWDEQWFASYE